MVAKVASKSKSQKPKRKKKYKGPKAIKEPAKRVNKFQETLQAINKIKKKIDEKKEGEAHGIKE